MKTGIGNIKTLSFHPNGVNYILMTTSILQILACKQNVQFVPET